MQRWWVLRNANLPLRMEVSWCQLAIRYEGWSKPTIEIEVDANLLLCMKVSWCQLAIRYEGWSKPTIEMDVDASYHWDGCWHQSVIRYGGWC
jgi:hypothetical protein